MPRNGPQLAAVVPFVRKAALRVHLRLRQEPGAAPNAARVVQALRHYATRGRSAQLENNRASLKHRNAGF